MSARRTFFTAVLVSLVAFQFAPAGATLAHEAYAAARCNWMEFVADMTVSDGSIKLPGETFIKTWRIKNIGSCPWTHDYELFFLQGDQMGAAKWTPMPTRVSPGESVDISVSITAPTSPGHYRGYFILRDESQNKFGMGAAAGNPFWLDILVSTQFAPGYDFAANACSATWRSGAGVLPCPGTDRDTRGYVVPIDQPKLEDGTTDPLSGLLVGPQKKFNGYIQGFYPEIPVLPGDRFQAIVGCAFGETDCLVTFRLDYQINNGAIHTFWQWNEKNEARTYRVDKDLSFLAGANVRFILTTLAAGPDTGDRAIWASPRFVRSGGGVIVPASPTPTSLGPPTVTPPGGGPTPTFTPPGGTPLPVGTVLDLTSDICSADWVSGAGRLPCPMSDGDARGFALRADNPVLENGSTEGLPGLIVAPQNKTDGYLQGFYPYYTVQPGDHFQASVGCANGSPCNVTYRLDYQAVDGGVLHILWKWSETGDNHVFNLDYDLSALAGKRVKLVLTLLASGSATGDRAIWGHPRVVRPGFVPPSPTPTAPPGSVTNVTVAVTPLGTAVCGGPNPVEFHGEITTNGAAEVTYHWEIGGDKTAVSTDENRSFPAAGTQAFDSDAFTANCGNYFVKLVVSAPNSISAQTIFSIPSGSSASSTPGPVPTTATPPAGTVLDFTSDICSADWVSGAGALPCPMTDGDARGFALRADNPVLENGTTDGLPGLIVAPQNKTDGYLQGYYPFYTVQPGDHFQASVGCANGSPCNVKYRLDYQAVPGGVLHILWQWTEAGDGQIFTLDYDLAALAGKNVRFVLTLLANGSAAGDRAVWGHPRIVRAGQASPTPTATALATTASPPPASSLRVAYIKSGSVWLWTDTSAAHALTSSGADSNVRLSDDSQVAAFQRGDELWAINTDGTNERALVSAAYLAGLGAQVRISSFQFVPHTHTLFIMTGVQGEAFFTANYDLQAVDADSPAPVQYAGANQGGLPVFSPDGGMALLVNNQKVNLINSNGTGLHEVYSFPVVSTFSEWSYIPPVAWTGGSGAFRIVVPPADSLSNPEETTKLNQVALAGGSTQVAEFLAVSIASSQPQLSPDGERVAFMRQADGGLELRIADASGGDSLYATFTNAGPLGWAPDSLGFVYWTGDVRNPSLAYLGGSAVTLSDAAHATNLRWISATRYLFMSDGQLRLRILGGAGLAIDSGLGSGEYDFDN